MAADQNAQYRHYLEPTERDLFLATMEQIVPWSERGGVIEPHYPAAPDKCRQHRNCRRSVPVTVAGEISRLAADAGPKPEDLCMPDVNSQRQAG